MPRELRKQQKLKRKNFFPSLIITMFLWIIIAGLVYLTDPRTFGVILLFFLLIFFACWFTFSVLSENRKRGLIIAGSITFFMILRYLGIGNILNLILLLGLAITIDYFFSK